MSKEKFKDFVKVHPELITTVKNQKYSWQKLYEIYILYGEDMNVWKEYIIKDEKTNPFEDLIGTFKGIDTATIQRGINSLQRALELFGGLLNKEFNQPKTANKPYEPRPIYKRFED
ncbi:MAG: hypothetical protein GX861_02380 [Tenericutes bacterium]|jgi:hypothetical protein|nr:hypothetical protein [Mycoplasmatota bacterium]